MLLTFNNTRNQIDGYCYDAAGNLLRDAACASNKYTYDAEGRIVTAQMNGGGTATYQYDGEGHRVRKSGGTTVDYLHDLGGRTILELSSATTWTRAEAFAPDGRHLATYSGGPAGTTYFHHSDWLGTERAHTSVGGTLAWACTSEPFGDGSTCTGAEATPDFFTGKERDSETGLDYFGARYFGSNMGRWMSPDWSLGPSSVPFARLTNPQSLDLYGFVNGNPISYADMDGHAVGDKYPTLDAAGTAAVQEFRAASMSKNREYGGWVKKNDDGTFSYTKAKKGAKDHVPDHGKRPQDAEAQYHTHGNGEEKNAQGKPKYDNEHFSNDDKDTLTRPDVNVQHSYLGTPEGAVLRYDVPPASSTNPVTSNPDQGVTVLVPSPTHPNVGCADSNGCSNPPASSVQQPSSRSEAME